MTSAYAGLYFKIAFITGAGRQFPFVPILVGVTILTLAIGAFLVFQNRDSIFVAQLPSSQVTPMLPQTRTTILRTATSEPDFFNTNTPVPTPSFAPADIPTAAPTAPLVIVIPTQQPLSNIPTITPIVRSTAVPQPPAPTTLPPPPLTAPASTPFFPTPTGRLRMGNGPGARAHSLLVSQFILDGYFNEWSGEGVPLTVSHFGTDNWLGPGDLSGTVWLGWNENFLLIAVNVFDDAHVQTQRGWEMFRSDSVELWIDADLEGDFEVAAGNGDDYQFGFSLGDFAGLLPEVSSIFHSGMPA